MVVIAATETATAIDLGTVFGNDVLPCRFLISSKARLQSVTTIMITRGQDADKTTEFSVKSTSIYTANIM